MKFDSLSDEAMGWPHIRKWVRCLPSPSLIL